MKTVLSIALIIMLAGCTKADTSRRVLESAGYTDVQMDGYAVFGCSDEDTFHDAFSAKGTNGKIVSGVVCSGWFKGATIRVD
jgi:hypothetical protein